MVMDNHLKLNENNTARNPILKWSLTRPLLVCMVLFVIALVIRWIDSFVLRMDERIGELILTKSLGFVLVLIFLWLTRRKLKDIGFRRGSLGQNLVIGTVTTGTAFIFGYGVDLLLASIQGSQPSLTFEAVDSKMGVTGGVLFAFWLLFCNVINSLMEEGLFRGVFGRLSRIHFNFWGANWFQAALFSIWHLPWVLKYYLVGEINTGGELASTIFYHSIPQLLIGIVYGYFYLKTGNLWGAWIAHFISNSVLNFLHVSTMDGIDTGLPIRMAVYTVVMLLSLFWVKYHAQKNNLEEVEPWE
jgi:membrane protease YdiL (CAAX protease family)